METKELKINRQKDKSLQDGNKLFYDVFKHLTTLSTGSILILVAFLEKLFIDPQFKFLIAISLLCFIINIVAAVRMMFLQAGAVLEMKATTDKSERISFLITVISFLAGISSFVFFALLNF